MPTAQFNYKGEIYSDLLKVGFPFHRYRGNIYATNFYCGANGTISVPNVGTEAQSKLAPVPALCLHSSHVATNGWA